MGKFVGFLFGIISYAVFFVAFLYAIGFVGNLYVPKTIDSGNQAGLVTSVVINLLLLSLFALQHSVMARPAFKRWLTGFISPAVERSLFILLSSLALLLIFWLWQPMTMVIWQLEIQWLAYVITGLYFLGWLVVLLSTFMINHFELFGLQQIYMNLNNKTAPTPKFQTHYFYKLCRHPIMLGFVIAFWAAPTMTVGHLLFSVVTTLYIIIAVKYLEEKDLKKFIGHRYEVYQKDVPMLIPTFRKK
jgi:protein-S-isoprenylcysteine O-methyltransferase Ste14